MAVAAGHASHRRQPAVEVLAVVMLFIFITLLGVALLSPIVALRFALARWFEPATVAARQEAAGGSSETTHLRPRLALSMLD
jgi:hypothetical protein